jgi:hypothetical protein
MTITTEAPPKVLTEAEASDALAKARAEQAQNASEISTLRAHAEAGRFVDPGQFGQLKIAEELTALRVIHAEHAHTDATDLANEQRRNEFADSVRPTIAALDAECATAADAFNDAARMLVSNVKLREQTVDQLYGQAHAVGASDRISTNLPGVRVDGQLLRHLGPRLLAEIQPSFSALLRSAGEPGMADNFRINHAAHAGIPRTKEGN